MLSSSKGVHAAYVDGSGPTEITFDLPAGDYEVVWVDVLTGILKSDRLHHKGGDWRVKTLPFRTGSPSVSNAFNHS